MARNAKEHAAKFCRVGCIVFLAVGSDCIECAVLIVVSDFFVGFYVKISFWKSIDKCRRLWYTCVVTIASKDGGGSSALALDLLLFLFGWSVNFGEVSRSPVFYFSPFLMMVWSSFIASSVLPKSRSRRSTRQNEVNSNFISSSPPFIWSLSALSMFSPPFMVSRCAVGNLLADPAEFCEICRREWFYHLCVPHTPPRPLRELCGSVGCYASTRINSITSCVALDPAISQARITAGVKGESRKICKKFFATDQGLFWVR